MSLVMNVRDYAYLVAYKDSDVGTALDNIKSGDLADYGYVYGSGADAKDAVLAAIADTGSVHVSGDIALSRFVWPQGARITGAGNVTSLRRPHLPARVESVEYTSRRMKGAYVFGEFDICDMLQLKTAGCNTIIHYQYGLNQGGNIVDAVNAAEAVGIKVIISSPNDVPPAQDIELGKRNSVIGFYVFDEPQHNGVSLAAQNARIAAWKAVTSKSICTADNGVFGWDNPSLSPNFDIIFPDLYYITQYDDPTNKRFAVLSMSEIKYKAPLSKLIPAVGLFAADSNTNLPKNLNFAQDIFKLGEGDYVAFAWDSSVSDPAQIDIITNQDLYNRFVDLNGIEYNQPYTIESCIFGPNLTLSDLVKNLNSRYTGEDVSPYRVISSGSAIDERHQVFGDSGLAYRNAGGIAALNMKCQGYLAATIGYRDHAFNQQSTVQLFTTQDDYYSSSEITSQIMQHNTAFSGGYHPVAGELLGINLSNGSSSTSPYFFKFISGGLVTSNWLRSTF